MNLIKQRNPVTNLNELGLNQKTLLFEYCVVIYSKCVYISVIRFCDVLNKKWIAKCFSASSDQQRILKNPISTMQISFPLQF